MYIYEVNVEVNPSVLPIYRQWLGPHIAAILKCPGFLQAEVFENREATSDGWIELSIQYQVQSLQHLDDYVRDFAPGFRADAESKFAGNFRARRRVLQLLDSQP